MQPRELKEVGRTPKLLVYFSRLEGKAAVFVLGKLGYSKFEGGTVFAGLGLGGGCSVLPRGGHSLLNLCWLSLLWWTIRCHGVHGCAE